MSPRGRKNPAARPDVTRYHDYRQFLRDWVAYRQQAEPALSLRSIAASANLSCAYLPSVLNGKRRLTRKSMALLQTHMGLPEREWDFFQTLVEATEGSSFTDRAQALERLQRLKAYRAANPREAETFRYLTKWFYVAIRELAAIRGFDANPEKIRDRLRGNLSRAQVEQALSFLHGSGLLRSVDGKIRPAEKDLRCLGEVFKVALREFHHQMLPVVLESLDQSPQDTHLILGHTMPIAQKDFPKVKEILEEALQRIEALSRKGTDPDAVYHVGLMAAPLTK